MTGLVRGAVVSVSRAMMMMVAVSCVMVVVVALMPFRVFREGWWRGLRPRGSGRVVRGSARSWRDGGRQIMTVAKELHQLGLILWIENNLRPSGSDGTTCARAAGGGDRGGGRGRGRWLVFVVDLRLDSRGVGRRRSGAGRKDRRGWESRKRLSQDIDAMRHSKKREMKNHTTGDDNTGMHSSCWTRGLNRKPDGAPGAARQKLIHFLQDDKEARTSCSSCRAKSWRLELMVVLSIASAVRELPTQIVGLGKFYARWVNTLQTPKKIFFLLGKRFDIEAGQRHGDTIEGERALSTN